MAFNFVTVHAEVSAPRFGGIDATTVEAEYEGQDATITGSGLMQAKTVRAGARVNPVVVRQVYGRHANGEVNFLIGDINNSQTTFEVSSNDGFYNGCHIILDEEVLKVISGPDENDTTWTVQRGMFGTTPDSHLAGV